LIKNVLVTSIIPCFAFLIYSEWSAAYYAASCACQLHISVYHYQTEWNIYIWIPFWICFDKLALKAL